MLCKQNSPIWMEALDFATSNLSVRVVQKVCLFGFLLCSTLRIFSCGWMYINKQDRIFCSCARFLCIDHHISWVLNQRPFSYFRCQALSGKTHGCAVTLRGSWAAARLCSCSWRARISSLPASAHRWTPKLLAPVHWPWTVLSAPFPWTPWLVFPLGLYLLSFVMIGHWWLQSTKSGHHSAYMSALKGSSPGETVWPWVYISILRLFLLKPMCFIHLILHIVVMIDVFVHKLVLGSLTESSPQVKFSFFSIYSISLWSEHSVIVF